MNTKKAQHWIPRLSQKNILHQTFFKKVYKFNIFITNYYYNKTNNSLYLPNLYDFSVISLSSNAVTDAQNVALASTSNHQEANIQNTQVSNITNDATNTPSVSPLVNGNEQHLSKQTILYTISII